MPVDLELYRRQVRVSTQPLVRLSVIDIAPEQPLHTLIFIHGFGGKAQQWQYQLHEFSFNNRVIAIDLRGHGQSDKPFTDYSMERIQLDLEKVIEELDVGERFILAGHSFGGAIVTEYAVAHPERIEQLILIATAGEFHLNPLYRLGLRLPLPILKAVNPFVHGWLHAPPQIMQVMYNQNMLKWKGWDLFKQLTVPTMIIRGHLDLVFAKPVFEEVARVIPGAVDIDVGASGHMVMLERRDAVNRAIQRGLDRTEGSWRDEKNENETTIHSVILHKRPWLGHYEEGVPATIAIPRVPLHHLVRSASHRYPLRTALIFEGYHLTYHQLNQEINRFANALRSIGVNQGDRIMLLLPNLPQMVISFFGALEAGAVPVFTLPSTDPDELMRQLHHSKARVLVTLTQFSELAQEAKAGLGIEGYSPLEHIIFTNIADYLPGYKRLIIQFSRQKQARFRLDIPINEGMHSFKELINKHNNHVHDIVTSPEDLAVIIYTGGTTAAPKGVMLSHRNLVANALQTRHWMPGAKDSSERFLSVLPFSHSYGLTTALILPIIMGATLILKATFDVNDVLKTIKRYRPTIFPGVPQMYVAIKDTPGVRKFGIDSIKACLSGSAPLPVEVQESFEKLTHGRLVEGYGLTEAGPVTHANPFKGQRKVGSIGLPLPSTEARVVDLKRGKHEAKIGHIGELAIRGPQVMLGYWEDPQATRLVIQPDGWLLTGDVAQMDTDGFFRIIARKADLWYPDKPENPAFPRDVEEVLYEVPQVKEASVVAIANQPIAFIITQKDNPSADLLIAYCKRRLPPELVPRLVIFVDDFPRSFIGKVLRRELAKRYESRTAETH